MRDWRNDRATDEQKAYADCVGIDYPAEIRRGELFDLILVEMERPPKRHFRFMSNALLWTSEEPDGRFQFSLRKLLLWTAVAAFLLGMAKMVEVAEVVLFFPVCWIIIVGSIALATSSKVARRVSVGVGAALGMFPLVFALWGGPRGGAPTLVFLIFPLLFGLLGGWMLFVVADVLCFGVDRIDKLFSRLGSRPHDPTFDD